MSKRHARIRLTCLLLVSLSGQCFAQHGACADQLSAGTPCCGQYECMADQVLALIETEADLRQPETTARSARADFAARNIGRPRSADPRAIQSTGAKGPTP